MRRTQAMTALVGLVCGTLFLLAPAASAQTTGYPPGLCTVLVGSQDVGSVTVGQTFTVQLAPPCVFTPGTSVTVTVNGVTVTGKVANASGFVLVRITATSATQLSVDDPTVTPAVCGVNTIVAKGPSAVTGGQTVTQTATFTLICPGTTTGATTTGATTTGGTTTGAATANTGRLSLTGTNSLRLLAIAIALVAIGSMFVVATRRRAASRG